MSSMDFDARSEQELAALESSATGEMLRSAAQTVVPQPQFSERLEAQLRALPTSTTEATGALASDDVSVSVGRSIRPTKPIVGSGRSSSRIWRVASVGLGLAATLVLAFLLSGLFSGRGGGRVAGTHGTDGSPMVSPGSKFVPEGQLRHLTFTASTIVTGTAEKPADKKLSGSSTAEFWLANDNGRLLARHGNPNSGESWQLLTNDAFYDHPDAGSATVYKYPYETEHVKQLAMGDVAFYVLPDEHILNDLLAMPGASNIGESTLEGRTVTVVSLPGVRPVLRTPDAQPQYGERVDRWYWIDRSTSQVARVEARFTTTSGDSKGFQFGVVIELTEDKILSRDTVASDYFAFPSGRWGTVVDGGASATTTTTSMQPENPPSKSGGASLEQFIPAGKVRMITLAQEQISTHTTGEVYTETTHIEQFWLAPGTNHPLMKTHVTVPSELWTWIDENSYYEYDPNQSSQLRTYPYDPKYQASVLPDPNIITSTLALPGAVSLGETMLDGRRALLIEVTGQNQPSAQSTPTPDAPSKGAVEPTPAEPANVEAVANTPSSTRYWIDLQTNQLLRVEVLDVAPDGSTKKFINYITQDVLISRDTLIADFFVPAVPATPVASPTALRAGEFAPDFTLNDVRTGKPVSLSSLRGKPVVLYFWGTWCPPCKTSLSMTQAVYDSIKGKAEIVGVSLGPRDTAALAKDYVDANHYTWTFVHDADYEVASAYRINSLPTYIFIDANGRLTDVHIGGLTSAMFTQYLDQIDPQLTIANPLGVASKDHPGWYVFTPFGGGFSVLMPKSAVEPSSRDGWEFYGVREGEALTYIAAYSDLNPSSSETVMVTEATTFMNGTARPERKAITLDGNPGLELVLDRTDGRFMRAHLYSVGRRILLVYVIAQDEQALFTPEMDAYLNSLILLNK